MLSSFSRVVRSSLPLGARGMALGSVKWFNNTKGFGFIQPDDKTQPDVFVHQSVIKCEGFRFLNENERVSFETSSSDRGVQASSVAMEDGKPFIRAFSAPQGGRGDGQQRGPGRSREDGGGGRGRERSGGAGGGGAAGPAS